MCDWQPHKKLLKIRKWMMHSLHRGCVHHRENHDDLVFLLTEKGARGESEEEMIVEPDLGWWGIYPWNPKTQQKVEGLSYMDFHLSLYHGTELDKMKTAGFLQLRLQTAVSKKWK